MIGNENTDFGPRLALQAARNLRGGRGASGLDDEALTREAKAIYQLEFRRENLLRRRVGEGSK